MQVLVRIGSGPGDLEVVDKRVAIWLYCMSFIGARNSGTKCVVAVFWLFWQKKKKEKDTYISHVFSAGIRAIREVAMYTHLFSVFFFLSRC